MAVAYGYARVSDNKQIDRAASLPSQISRIEDYYETMIEPAGVVWGKVFKDMKGMRCSRKGFMQRPAGIECMATLQRGDHLIMDKVDRIWRSILDYAVIHNMLRDRGVVIHFCDTLGDKCATNTPSGNYLLSSLVAFSQLESEMKSQRRIEANLQRRSEGYMVLGGHRMPYGITVRKVRCGRAIRYHGTWNWDERNRIRRAIQYQKSGISQDKICDIFNQEDCKERGVAWTKSAWRDDYDWHQQKLWLRIKQEKQYQDMEALGYTEPHQMYPVRERERIIEEQIYFTGKVTKRGRKAS